MFARRSAGCINVCQDPSIIIMFRSEFDGETEIITEHKMTMEKMRFPDGGDALEAPIDGKNSKLSKLLGQNFLINWESNVSLLVS